MTELDGTKYAAFYRGSYLVLAELILRFHADELRHDHRKKTARFVESFRRNRSIEAEKAQAVLALFDQYDVHNIEGQKSIQWEWVKIEGLDGMLRMTAYERTDGGFCLP